MGLQLTSKKNREKVRSQEALRTRLLLECSPVEPITSTDCSRRRQKAGEYLAIQLLVYQSFETPKSHGFGFSVLAFLLAYGTVGRRLSRLLNGNGKLREGSLILADEISFVIQLLILFTPYIGRRSVHFLVLRRVARAPVYYVCLTLLHPLAALDRYAWVSPLTIVKIMNLLTAARHFSPTE